MAPCFNLSIVQHLEQVNILQAEHYFLCCSFINIVFNIFHRWNTDGFLWYINNREFNDIGLYFVNAEVETNLYMHYRSRVWSQLRIIRCLMEDELEKIPKEAFVALSRNHPQNCLDWLKKPRNISFMILVYQPIFESNTEPNTEYKSTVFPLDQPIR